MKKISFKSIKEVEEREEFVQEQLEVLYKQQRDLEKSISKLEAEMRLLNDIALFIRGKHKFVGYFNRDRNARD